MPVRPVTKRQDVRHTPRQAQSILVPRDLAFLLATVRIVLRLSVGVARHFIASPSLVLTTWGLMVELARCQQVPARCRDESYRRLSATPVFIRLPMSGRDDNSGTGARRMAEALCSAAPLLSGMSAGGLQEDQPDLQEGGQPLPGAWVIALSASTCPAPYHEFWPGPPSHCCGAPLWVPTIAL